MKTAYSNLLRGYDNSHRGCVSEMKVNKKAKNRKSKYPDSKSYVLPRIYSSPKK